jgi:hypothetical protein
MIAPGFKDWVNEWSKTLFCIINTHLFTCDIFLHKFQQLITRSNTKNVNIIPFFK